jgi:hypothetical protein
VWAATACLNSIGKLEQLAQCRAIGLVLQTNSRWAKNSDDLAVLFRYNITF